MTITSSEVGLFLKSNPVAVIIVSWISNVVGSKPITSGSSGCTIHLGSSVIMLKTYSRDVENLFLSNRNLISANTIVGIMRFKSSSRNTSLAFYPSFGLFSRNHTRP